MTAPCGIARPLLQSVWLGTPGKMAALPIPDGGMQSSIDRGETDHQLVSGGTTTTRRPTVKRSWPLSWSQLTPDEADTLVAYYAGVRGTGPFLFVDPRWRNLLDADTSSMFVGGRGVQAWVTDPNAPNPQTTGNDGPPLAATSNVMRWAQVSTTNRILWAGMNDGSGYRADRTRTPPVLGVTGWATVWVKLENDLGNNVTCSVRVYAISNDGTTINSTTATGPYVLLTTDWQRLTVAYSYTQTQGGYLAMNLQVPTNVAGTNDLLVAGAQLTAETTSGGAFKAAAFNVGLGCPRVTIGAAGLDDQSSVWWRRSHALTLNEA